MTAGVEPQIVLPDSNPGLPKSWVVVAQAPDALTVTDTVVVCEPDAAVPVMVSVNVPAPAAVVTADPGGAVVSGDRGAEVARAAAAVAPADGVEELGRIGVEILRRGAGVPGEREDRGHHRSGDAGAAEDEPARLTRGAEAVV